jgi:hypothetical protein
MSCAPLHVREIRIGPAIQKEFAETVALVQERNDRCAAELREHVAEHGC